MFISKSEKRSMEITIKDMWKLITDLRRRIEGLETREYKTWDAFKKKQPHTGYDEKMNKPRPYSLVKFTEEAKQHINPFDNNNVFVFLGEIPNKPGHCIVFLESTGKTWVGFETNSLIEIDEEET
jgi:hypothetical protein